MPPAYDLILQRQGEWQTETVQVKDAAQAWRLGRERYPDCIRGVARGLTNQGIGSSLGISLETVKTHVVNAKDKLGDADRTQLAVMALLYGLIDPLG